MAANLEFINTLGYGKVMHVIKIEAMFVCKRLMSGNLCNLQLRYVELCFIYS